MTELRYFLLRSTPYLKLMLAVNLKPVDNVYRKIRLDDKNRCRFTLLTNIKSLREFQE